MDLYSLYAKSRAGGEAAGKQGLLKMVPAAGSKVTADGLKVVAVGNGGGVCLLGCGGVGSRFSDGGQGLIP